MLSPGLALSGDERRYSDFVLTGVLAGRRTLVSEAGVLALGVRQTF